MSRSRTACVVTAGFSMTCRTRPSQSFQVSRNSSTKTHHDSNLTLSGLGQLPCPRLGLPGRGHGGTPRGGETRRCPVGIRWVQGRGRGEVAGVKLCWCPAGKFTMGGPPDEPERRPGEDQVEVTLTQGFWAGKFEVTQGQWKRVIGKLPGELTAELPEGDSYPVGSLNFAEAEAFCQKLTVLAQQSGELPNDWEFRLPTERSGNMPAGPGPRPPRRSAASSAASRPTSRASPTTAPRPGRRSRRRPRSGATQPTPGGCTTCTATPSSGAATGTTRSCPAASIPTCTPHGPRHSRTETAHIAGRRGGCWADDGWPCRSACRLRFEPERRYDHIGFRVVAVQR